MIMNEGKNLSIFFLKASLNFQHTASTFANGKAVKLTVSSLREINLLGAMTPNWYRGCVFLNSHNTQPGTAGNFRCRDTCFVLQDNLRRTIGSGFEMDQDETYGGQVCCVYY